jgi:DNA-binding MarR family transcriptional regulator
MDNQIEETRKMMLLEQIENDPDITQASLADLLGVAVGTVNWHINRLIDKGYVKVMRAQRRKLRYLITPKGIALRAKLTVNYVENQMRLYRRTRQRVSELLEQVKADGYKKVRITGEGDIADICRLTCIEQGITVVEDGSAQEADLPKLDINGLKVFLRTESKI